jgi:hypothetical protein
VTPEADRLLVELGYLLDGRPETVPHWVAGELRYVRRAAQADAERAYDAWRQHPRGATYAAYRAAQDRADAAQDHLAQWLSISPRG